MQPKRYNLRNELSRVLSPGYVKNLTLESLIAFTFVEYFTAAEGQTALAKESEPWVLTAFEPKNEPYYNFIDKVHLNIKSDEEYEW